MAGQILQPNYTALNEIGSIASFQNAWKYSSTACYRPSPDLDIPIACSAFGNPRLNITSGPSAGANDVYLLPDYSGYEMYTSCCPQSGNNRTQLYLAWRDCPAAMCFTTAESVGKGFDECVRKRAEEELAKLKKNGTVPNDTAFAREAYGRCEYVDYEMLKKGIIKSDASSLLLVSKLISITAVVATILCL